MSPRLALFLLLALPLYPQQPPSAEVDRVRRQIDNYVAAVNAADDKLAARVWDTSPDVSFVHPLGEARGWREVKAFYTDIMGGMYSERKLTPRDVDVHVYGDSAWAQFHWRFVGKQKKDGAVVQSEGRETQIFRRDGKDWRLVHVHYSAMPGSR